MTEQENLVDNSFKMFTKSSFNLKFFIGLLISLQVLSYILPSVAFNTKSFKSDIAIGPNKRSGKTFSQNSYKLRASPATLDISTQTEWKTAQEVSESSKVPPTIFDIEKIKTILPHRYPFLLIDKVVQFEPGVKATAIKQITGNEDQFNGHFPNRAIMPGVLQLEALAQLGGIVCLQEPISDGKGDFFFAGVEGVKWKKPIVPGDTLVLETELVAWRSNFGIAKMTGRGYVDGQLALSVKELIFALVK